MDGTISFLENPSEIRKAICDLASRCKHLDIAVAFIGADWWDCLGNYTKNLRVICWLSNRATNPYAVRDMCGRKHAQVKQRQSMHAKVYIAPGIGAVVGSANLSKAALEKDWGVAGQDEAAILVRDSQVLKRLSGWFDRMWKDALLTKHITKTDLRTAIVNWNKAQSAMQQPNKKARAWVPPLLPDPLPNAMRALARKFATLNLAHEFAEFQVVISQIYDKGLTKNRRSDLVALLTSWTKHAAPYEKFKATPISKARKGLGLLWDESKPIEARLAEIQQKKLLPGMLIPSMSLLLHWWKPEKYVPYDAKTKKFLHDFKLKSKGMSSSSPVCYANWLSFAAALQQRLGLPLPGHIDRMVTEHYSQRKRTKPSHIN